MISPLEKFREAWFWGLTLKYKEDQRDFWRGLHSVMPHVGLPQTGFGSALSFPPACKIRSISVFPSFWLPIQGTDLWTSTHAFPQILHLSRAHVGSQLRTDGEGCCLRKAEMTALHSGLNVLKIIYCVNAMTASSYSNGKWLLGKYDQNRWAISFHTCFLDSNKIKDRNGKTLKSRGKKERPFLERHI